jgi:hypothetical protein
MAERKNVGTSWHTQAKHALMHEFISKEVRVANRLSYYERLFWMDLTAGDGAAHDGEWHHACSPGILAHNAATTTKQPVVIVLYEKDRATYGRLVANLAVQLPPLGYIQDIDGWWRLDGARVLLRALNEDGRTARIDYLRNKDAVLILNDPNSITGFAMRPGFAKEVDGRVKGLRVLSTLGCNVSGIKRARLSREGALPIGGGLAVMSLTERKSWFELINEQAQSLPDRHDLLLVCFDRDRDQWAYLVSQPRRWRENDETRAEVRKAFAGVGRTARMAWYRRSEGVEGGPESDQFKRLKDELFYTKSELHEQANTPLPFDGTQERGDAM